MPHAQQFDLFDAPPPAFPPAVPGQAPPPPLSADALDDAALIDALPRANRADCQALADAAVRRQLVAAVPAFDALVRRFRGFGRDSVIAEQRVALAALAAIGGALAATVVTRLLVDHVVEDPGLPHALAAAAALGCRLPPDTCLPLLCHANPSVRAVAARLAVPRADVTALTIELLGDLNAEVADAAALALGRQCRVEARAKLLALLRAAPTAAVIEAIVGVADEACIVELNRTAHTRPDLVPRIIDVLDDIEDPLAGRVAAALRK